MDVLRTAVSMLSLYDPLAKDMSPAANQLKATKLMAQTSTIVSSFGRLRTAASRWWRPIRAEFRREFSLLPDGQEAGRHHGAHLRCGADPACGPRTERFHICGARDGRDAFGYLFVR